MGFAEELYRLRKEAGLSQKELANEIGVAQASINYWEKGQRTPSISMVTLVADYFHVSIENLLTRNEHTQLEEYEQKQREEAAKNAPRFTDRAESTKKTRKFFSRDKKGGTTNDGKPPKFTDASTSFEESQAQEEAHNLLDSIHNEEPLSWEREEIAIQLRDILKSYSELNNNGRKMAVKRIEELCYSDVMTDSRQDDIYFDRIKKKIENGEKLAPDEIEWWHNYLDKSVKTVGAIFESLFSMLNKEGRRKAHTQINRAIEQIELLTKIPEYRKETDPKSPTPPQE